MGERPYLSVVIPAYNEEERLARSLPLIAAYLREERIEAEILVVDDGSTDGTAALASRLLRGGSGRLLRHPENRGRGFAVRRGVLQAQGRWVLLADAGLSVPIEQHAHFAAAARDHDLDVVIGSRALEGSRLEGRESAARRFVRVGFNRIVGRLTGLASSDTQCSFKLLDRERTRPLFERMVVERCAFDVELLFLCDRFGLRVREVPVVWRHDPSPKASLPAKTARMLIDVLRVRWRFRRGAYHPAKLASGADAGSAC